MGQGIEALFYWRTIISVFLTSACCVFVRCWFLHITAYYKLLYLVFLLLLGLHSMCYCFDEIVRWERSKLAEQGNEQVPTSPIDSYSTCHVLNRRYISKSTFIWDPKPDVKAGFFLVQLFNCTDFTLLDRTNKKYESTWFKNSPEMYVWLFKKRAFVVVVVR